MRILVTSQIRNSIYKKAGRPKPTEAGAPFDAALREVIWNLQKTKKIAMTGVLANEGAANVLLKNDE